MNIRHYITILFLTGIFVSGISAQTNCTVPLPPTLTSVSVQPETGKTEFTWLPSPSSDIAAYIIYSYKDGDGLAIDTVWDPAATSHTISNTAPKYASVSYVVAAHRVSSIPGLPGCTSPLSNVLSTIFCKADIDTCNKKILISWNSYPSVPKMVTGYAVMMSVNGNNYTEETITGSEENNFILDDFQTAAQYCFYIRANLADGTSSTSNKACLLTNMQRPPGWINADYATVDSENGINLSFTIDPLSEIRDFLLERKTGPGGSYQAIAQRESVEGSVLYTDSEADVSIVNYYRLSAINNCLIPVTVSNISSNIVLGLVKNGNDFNLSWNPYREWLGSVSGYRLMIDTGSGFQEKAAIPANDTVYKLDYKGIMYEVSGTSICMYITASEISNPYSIYGQTNSSVVCTEPVEVISVPNIFTPNNDLKNDLFRPVLSFTPVSYHLIVSDQHGSVLFETRDSSASWDGSKNGSPEPDGVCLWFLKVTTPSGKSLTRTGTITILKNP
jgi:gliding motility-associated-like protein